MILWKKVVGIFDISALSKMSGINPDLWNVGLYGGDIIILSLDVIWRSLIPLGLFLGISIFGF